MIYYIRKVNINVFNKLEGSSTLTRKDVWGQTIFEQVMGNEV
jgi:hypothetical protein